MRDWLVNLLRKDLGGLEINLFDGWHIGYLLLIFGLTLAFHFIFRKKSEKTKTRVVNVMLILATLSYVLDFIVMPLYTGEIDIDKLPFHVCTIMAIVACFAQFNKHFTWLKTPAVILSVVAPLMYMCYPGSALGDISPICYKVVQTFFYHGTLFMYGTLSLSLGLVKVKIKKCWKELLLILAIAAWAGLGNYLFNNDVRHFDWFFLTGSTFPFIPKYLMPIVVVSAVFGMVIIIYGLYYLLKKITKKKSY